MTKLMKQQLINDVLTGLMVAATFALAAPTDAFAQLATSVTSTQGQVFKPVMNVLGYGCYGAGAFIGILGIMGVKKHADKPGQEPLGPGLAKLGAGAALVAVPSVVGVIQGTGNNVFTGTGNASGINF